MVVDMSWSKDASALKDTGTPVIEERGLLVLGGVRVVSKSPRQEFGGFPFECTWLIYRQRREPTSGLEPLT